MRPSAWVFLMGKAHAEYRRGLGTLFTNKALSIYLHRQEAVFEDYFDRFVATSEAAGSKPIPFFKGFRELNCGLSCRTFFGDYISEESITKIADEFYIITAALELVNFPYAVHIPFTKPWWGKRVSERVLKEFTASAERAKEHMATGAKPTCTVDEWIMHMNASEEYRRRVAAGETEVEKPVNLIRQFSAFEMAQTMFTFLFASQDASASATIFLFQILAQRPDVLEKVREENLAVRGGDKNVPYTLEIYEKLTYTNAVVKELLRWRPPVIFIPYNVDKDFPITPDYTIPKGSMVVPSAYPALHDPVAYPNPETFDPERWITGDAETKTRNWLVFGSGAHDCLARKYVPLSMALMIGKAAMGWNWVHHPTPLSDKIRVFACLFPEVCTNQKSPNCNNTNEAGRMSVPWSGADGRRKPRWRSEANLGWKRCSALERRSDATMEHT